MSKNKAVLVLAYTTIFVVSIMVLSAHQVFGEETTSNTKKLTLAFYPEKLIQNKYTSVFSSNNETVKFTLHIVNTGNQIASGSVFLGDLTLSDQSSFSIAPTIISSADFTVTDSFTDLKMGKSETITISLTKELNESGTYEGEILIYGTNLDSAKVPVELTIKHNPLELIGFTVLGIGIAVGIGIWAAINDVVNKNASDYGTRKKTIKHINSHIKNLNNKRNFITKDDWSKIIAEHISKKEHIELYSNKLEAPDKKVVEWYHEQDLKLKHDAKSKQNENKELEEIKNPEYNATLISEITNKDFNPSNLIFVIISAAVASPAILFTENLKSLVGSPTPDILIAIAIGFGIYESKKIGEKIKSTFKL